MPRCGYEVERGREADMKEGAEEHLKTCDDKKAIAAYKKKVAEEKEREKKKEKAVETQEDVMAFKTWEHNGRQVGLDGFEKSFQCRSKSKQAYLYQKQF